MLYLISLYLPKQLHGVVRDDKLEDLVKEQAKTDLVGAKENLADIVDSSYRERTQLAIIQNEIVERSPTIHQEIAEIAEPLMRYRAEMRVALEDPKHNFDKTIETALKIVDIEERDKALGNIVEVQSQFDFEGSKATASRPDAGRDGLPTLRLAMTF